MEVSTTLTVQCVSISTSALDSAPYSYFLLTAQPAPTLGAYPDKSEWFHCTRIHTIVDGRLRLPKNKAMKLLISIFFILLLNGFAGGSYGQTDFEVTKLLAEQGEAFAQYNL